MIWKKAWQNEIQIFGCLLCARVCTWVCVCVALSFQSLFAFCVWSRYCMRCVLESQIWISRDGVYLFIFYCFISCEKMWVYLCACVCVFVRCLDIIHFFSTLNFRVPTAFDARFLFLFSVRSFICLSSSRIVVFNEHWIWFSYKKTPLLMVDRRKNETTKKKSSKF